MSRNPPMPLLEKHSHQILGELKKLFPQAKEVTSTAMSESVIRNPNQTEETKCYSIQVKIISKI